MAEAVYLLCATASAVCAALLVRAYLQNRRRILFWSAVCFVGLMLNSIMVVVDLILVPNVDLSWVRGLVAVIALGSLLFGLIWDAR
jgi:hypothetical protein